jgi:cellulose synthase/poly-beta-1,6-N-acetylglucosamine synthase-like glycosyltransferase
MTAVEVLLWIFVAIVFYAYIGYGIILWILLKFRRLFAFKPAGETASEFHPPVTLVIPAFNEEEFIAHKIENTRSLDYPADLLEVIFITDGSTDRTPEIIAAHSQFRLMHSEERKGKIAAMNRAMKAVNTPFVIFCDANTLLNKSAVKEIVKHYIDPDVGGVAGEKKVIDSNSTGAGESLYWKYESALKKLDSDFYTVVGAAGELFSFRTELFEEVPKQVLLDDFIISLKICKKGYRVIYEPNAYAMEHPSENIKEEQKRKIRISVGAFQSIIMLKSLFNVFKYPRLSFLYISHRILRWAVCPFLLPLILFLNVLIAFHDGGSLVYSLLVLQLAFYLLGFLGWLFVNQDRKPKIFNFPFYFLFMNYSLYLGLVRFLKGNQTVLWEKARRGS